MFSQPSFTFRPAWGHIPRTVEASSRRAFALRGYLPWPRGSGRMRDKGGWGLPRLAYREVMLCVLRMTMQRNNPKVTKKTSDVILSRTPGYGLGLFTSTDRRLEKRNFSQILSAIAFEFFSKIITCETMNGKLSWKSLISSETTIRSALIFYTKPK